MNDLLNYRNSDGLKFFGKITAGISHELKNIMAIISETSGFLNDLAGLAKQGKELKLSSFENCCESIAEEIQRGFETIKLMNRFSHSVDVPVTDVDLLEALNLTVKLSGFLNVAGKVQIEKKEQVFRTVLTCPFLLQHLMHEILCLIRESAGPSGVVEIHISVEHDHGLLLRFLNSSQTLQEKFSDGMIRQLADVLGVAVTWDNSLNGISLMVPYISSHLEIVKKVQ